MTGGLLSVQGEKAVRRALSAGEDQAAKTRGGQKQNEHDHGNNVAHHHAVELCAAEVLAVFLDLGDDPLRGPTTQPTKMLVSRLMKGMRKLLLM